jgi:hypothetical protein
MDLLKRIMKKLLLLDADVIIDLHIFGLFEKMAKAYEIKVTKEVFREAKYYPKGSSRVAINIKDKVTIIEDVDVSCIKLVAEEACEALLTIDSKIRIKKAYEDGGLEALKEKSRRGL